MDSMPDLSIIKFVCALRFLVVLISVATVLVRGTNSLYLAKQQESTPVVSSGIEWSENGGTEGLGGGLLRRAPVENLAPRPPPGPAMVYLDILRNVISDILQFCRPFLT